MQIRVQKDNQMEPNEHLSDEFGLCRSIDTDILPSANSYKRRDKNFLNTSVYVSILSLMFITFERWRAITCPLKSPLQTTRYVIAGTWVVAMIMSSPEPYTLHLKSAEFRRPNFSSTKVGLIRAYPNKT
ncbi:hypothetical protein NECAME_06806 [Necator americanus]|uniref:G-protein coupled receptors family 1 profile domain-containing protein n=1 Tax=Necator americanus TaxID=51031 RepID=W2TR90_NECAM|nr:hypothetical protein NECAME_06806 [Necator americanus]ETN84570.1 hypothetical protein NECAME_06806 [Necator americanus]